MPSASRPRRIRVVGNSGAGKSTLARALAERLDVPYIELDEVFWGPNWTKKDPAQARAALTGLLTCDAARDGWVLDGNWNNARDGVGEDSDVIIWLDFSRAVVMRRVIWRTVARAVTRKELWHGNRERPRSWLSRDPEENIILWAWISHDNNRERYENLARTGRRMIRVRTPRQARRLLATAR